MKGGRRGARTPGAPPPCHSAAQARRRRTAASPTPALSPTRLHPRRCAAWAGARRAEKGKASLRLKPQCSQADAEILKPASAERGGVILNIFPTLALRLMVAGVQARNREVERSARGPNRTGEGRQARAACLGLPPRILHTPSAVSKSNAARVSTRCSINTLAAGGCEGTCHAAGLMLTATATGLSATPAALTTMGQRPPPTTSSNHFHASPPASRHQHRAPVSGRAPKQAATESWSAAPSPASTFIILNFTHQNGQEEVTLLWLPGRGGAGLPGAW